MDAAYNYEYAIRTRDTLAKPRAARPRRARRKRAPTRPTKATCRPARRCTASPGAPPAAVDMNQFKIVIPKRGEERKDAPDAGKGGQKIRKG